MVLQVCCWDIIDLDSDVSTALSELKSGDEGV